MATLDRVIVEVKLSEGSVQFAIRNPKPLSFTMEPEVRGSLPRQLVPKYTYILLAASNILDANDDARSRLRPLGDLHRHTRFWFDRGSEGSVSVVDRDPKRHRMVYIGGDLPRASAQQADFSKAVAASKYIEGTPRWNDGALYLKLKSEFALPDQRLATYEALVDLL